MGAISSGRLHQLAVAAEALGDEVVADDGRVDADGAAHLVEHPLLLHGPGVVTVHDGHQGRTHAGGGLELLQVEPKGAVAAEQEHGTIGTGQLGPDGVRETGAEVPEVPSPQKRPRYA